MKFILYSILAACVFGIDDAVSNMEYIECFIENVMISNAMIDLSIDAQDYCGIHANYAMICIPPGAVGSAS
jgi:hypothetical protein